MPFASIVGHPRLVSLLSRAIARDALPPSLLLAGPGGIGKRRVAMAVAETLNCLDLRRAETLPVDACGVCAACKRIARMVHPDVPVVAPDDKGTISIDVIRDVIDKSGYRPFEGRRRVVVVDEADAMTVQAQSALLKTLEEPPPGSVFVLVSSMADSLLTTVRSRCPRLRFATLSPAEIAEVLVRDHGYTDADARVAAVDAGGSVGRALQAEAADVALALEDARGLLAMSARGVDPVRRIQAVKDLFPKKSTPALDREHLAARLRALGSLLRDLSVLLVNGSPALLVNADLEGELKRLVTGFDGERAARNYAAVDRALAALDRNASAKIVADWLVLQL
ncbi:MAG: DNA polymerase III subunit delta' [Vicinamibacterales bacterium]